MTKFLSICVSLAISGCASTPTPHITIGLPHCERPIAITVEIWGDPTQDVGDLRPLRSALSHNSLVDAECIASLRARIRLHDAAR